MNREHDIPSARIVLRRTGTGTERLRAKRRRTKNTRSSVTEPPRF